MKAFLLDGGSMIVETSDVLVSYLQEEGCEVTRSEDAEHLCGTTFAECNVLVLNSCLWTGSGHTISLEAKQALARHLESGKGIVAMHSSIGNWDDWPQYREWIGAAWDWRAVDGSKHTSPDSIFTIEVVEPHPIVEGVPATFEVTDEMYYNLRWAEGNHVIARTTGAFGGHPIVWHRRSGNARVAAIMLGHSLQACSHPSYISMFKQACAYTSGGGKA